MMQCWAPEHHKYYPSSTNKALLCKQTRCYISGASVRLVNIRNRAIEITTLPACAEGGIVIVWSCQHVRALKER